MESNEDFRTKLVRTMGIITILSWIIILGPVGVLLLGGLAHSMVAERPATGAFWGILIFLPLVLTIVWGALTLLEFLLEKRTREAARPLTTMQTGPALRTAALTASNSSLSQGDQ
jgi:hypothetical protein